MHTVFIIKLRLCQVIDQYSWNGMHNNPDTQCQNVDLVFSHQEFEKSADIKLQFFTFACLQITGFNIDIYSHHYTVQIISPNLFGLSPVTCYAMYCSIAPFSYLWFTLGISADLLVLYFILVFPWHFKDHFSLNSVENDMLW